MFEKEAATTADTENGTVCTKPDDDFIATSIVVPSDLIDIKIEREAPKVKLRKKLDKEIVSEFTGRTFKFIHSSTRIHPVFFTFIFTLH